MAAVHVPLDVLAINLDNTVSPDNATRKNAEKYLCHAESSPNFALQLLTLVDNETLNVNTRKAAAIAFKNFVKRNWESDEVGVNKISQDDRAAIKTNVVRLMLKSPENIQLQLEDAIAHIGKLDFPDQWPSLMNELIEYMVSSQDFHVINGVLKMAHSLFKRYRYEFKSQQLWLEIKLVLDQFAKPFTELFVKTVELSRVHAGNPEALKIIYSSLVLSSKIFYSLNTQELPEFFEDNMNIWFPLFLNLLSVSNDTLSKPGDDEAGLIEQLKSQICDNVGMYVSKYGEEFEPHLAGFVQSVWTLLTTIGNEAKYDILVSNAMKFLKTVADRPANKPLFESSEALDNLCSKVIIPNMQFRASDEEMFEDDAEEFIRRDIEGSDVDTRRRAACDLVKSLSRYFEPQIVAVFGQYIQQMLASYAANPKEQWRNKDAAVYLVVSMAAKGSTSRDGVTNASGIVNVVEFYTNFIISDLRNNPNINDLPVLRADALKFIVTFRNQLDVQTHIVPALPVIIQHLNAESIVVHSYAANAIEKLLSLRNPVNNRVGAITPQELKPLIAPLLQGCFAILVKRGSTENEYVMKALMKTFITLDEEILPFMEELLPPLVSKLQEVSKNPTKPNFNHYLFETLGICVKIGCQKNKSFAPSFEQLLFPIFENILAQDVQEFSPYVFQMLSSILEFYDKGTVPETYGALFQSFLSPVLWDRPTNIYGLVRFLRCYIQRACPQIVHLGKMEPLLGVFQKLIASKMNDHEGFAILFTLVLNCEPAVLEKYIKNIFFVLFNRLTASKTFKFVKNLLVLFSLYTFKYGPESLSSVIDSLQANMFSMVLNRLFIPELQKIDGNLNRKICAVGVTMILCNHPALHSGVHMESFAGLLQAVVGLIELPPDKEGSDEVLLEDEIQEYQPSNVRLSSAIPLVENPFGETVPDVKVFVAQSFKSLFEGNARIKEKAKFGMDAMAFAHLQSYILKLS